MKGVVFTEFLDMVESLFSADMVDDIIEDCTLKSSGTYTSVGTYDYEELLLLVTALSKRSDLAVKELVQKYGHHLFFRFHDMFPVFFEKQNSAFEFLGSVHGHVHVEVKKLYPDAALPNFETKNVNENELVMIYRSHCPFSDFAEGLIHGCVEFYDENIEIRVEDKNTKAEFCRVFTLLKH